MTLRAARAAGRRPGGGHAGIVPTPAYLCNDRGVLGQVPAGIDAAAIAAADGLL